MTENRKPRKMRKDIKLTADKLAMIEKCLKLGFVQADIVAVTGINKAVVSTVKLVLAYAGRL